MDDAYLNGMARLCGLQATLVYSSLCRHANKYQYAFPSIKLMSEQHSVHRDTIIKGIKNLEKRNVIEIEKKRTKDGKWLNNTYILIDRSEWNYNHVGVSNVDSRVAHTDMDNHVSHVGVSNTPSRCERHGKEIKKKKKSVGNKEYVKDSHVGVSDTKVQGNTYKETHSRRTTSCKDKKTKKRDNSTNKDNGNSTPSDSVPVEAKKISEIIKTFESVNLSCKRMYNNITQRKACSFLLDEYGFSKTIKTILKLKESNEKNYFPTILTPYQLADKWTNLETAEKREKNQTKSNLSESVKAPPGKYSNDKVLIV